MLSDQGNTGKSVKCEKDARQTKDDSISKGVVKTLNKREQIIESKIESTPDYPEPAIGPLSNILVCAFSMWREDYICRQ